MARKANGKKGAEYHVTTGSVAIDPNKNRGVDDVLSYRLRGSVDGEGRMTRKVI